MEVNIMEMEMARTISNEETKAIDGIAAVVFREEVRV